MANRGIGSSEGSNALDKSSMRPGLAARSIAKILIVMFACTGILGMAALHGSYGTAAIAGAAATGYGKTTTENVNIRKESTAKSARVVLVKQQGTPVLVYGAETNSGGETWYSVEMGAYRGYIKGDLLEAIPASEYDALHDAMGGTAVDWVFVNTSEEASSMRIGNVLTNKYHRRDCGNLRDVTNQVEFSSEDAAVNAGYIPCKSCDP